MERVYVTLPASRQSQTTIPRCEGVGFPPEYCMARTLFTTLFRLMSGHPSQTVMNTSHWRYYVSLLIGSNLLILAGPWLPCET